MIDYSLKEIVKIRKALEKIEVHLDRLAGTIFIELEPDLKIVLKKEAVISKYPSQEIRVKANWVDDSDDLPEPPI
jgi:hypothetical protein